MHSYGMGESDRGFCNDCNWELKACKCIKLRKCSNCPFTLTVTAKQFTEHICSEVNFDAERAAHKETQAKLERLMQPPDNEAWKSVVKYAYADGGDGARNIQSITSHYNAMRNELEETQAIARELQADKERLDWLDANGTKFRIFRVYNADVLPELTARVAIDLARTNLEK